MTWPLFVFLLLFGVAAAACQTRTGGPAPAAATAPAAAAAPTGVQAPVTTKTPAFQNVGPGDLQALLAREDPFLVNVHVPNEGYLAGTDARIPYTDVAGRVAELPADRGSRIVVYCLTGRMSAIAAEELVRLGYRDVLNLDGGMAAWQSASYPVLSD